MIQREGSKKRTRLNAMRRSGLAAANRKAYSDALPPRHRMQTFNGCLQSWWFVQRVCVYGCVQCCVYSELGGGTEGGREAPQDSTTVPEMLAGCTIDNKWVSE
mmetsp:Transcript_20995/g.51181  ORF Transcript_20995/g.51181 Transcript_20995/m.51181 type:complete len:103 (-) Transcript_20995:916-1224(-)